MKYINDNKIQKQRKGEREMGGGVKEGRGQTA